jgi:hypothetical protein
MILQL